MVILSMHVFALPVVHTAVPRPPPMGWNSWNYYACNINASVMDELGEFLVSSKLADLGFTYVNSDDCWMSATRTANGEWVPDPIRFPDGIAPLASKLHARGLHLGLYTARAATTCQKRAGSCNHTTVDANWLAARGVDYLKEDDCGKCGVKLTDYAAMQRALDATNRSIVLTIEGTPDVRVASVNGIGTARRVGHDIGPSWLSMISLVDIGAGLYPYAHNGSSTASPPRRAFYNDLDILEIGNGDFSAVADDDDADDSRLAMARAHYTMWCAMKAVLLLGNDLPRSSAATLAIIGNPTLAAMNQDPWGVQAQRVSRTPARNQTITEDVNAAAVFEPCDEREPLQSWRYDATSGALSTVDTRGDGAAWCLVDVDVSPGSLRAVRCNNATATNPDQKWVWTTAEESLLQLTDAAHPKNKLGFVQRLGSTGPTDRSVWTCMASALCNNTHTVRLTFNGSDGTSSTSSGFPIRIVSGGTGPSDKEKGRKESNMCLRLESGAVLEVWAGLLSGWRYAVVLLNRSPAADDISIDVSTLSTWRDGTHGSGRTWAVRDVWANASVPGVHSGVFTRAVPAHGVVLLILSAPPPQAHKVAAPVLRPILQFNQSLLALTRKRLDAGDPALVAAVARLEAHARGHVQSGPYSVTRTLLAPPSGDPHDYMSTGVYLWPCSSSNSSGRCNLTACVHSACNCSSVQVCGKGGGAQCDNATGLPWASCDGHENRAQIGRGAGEQLLQLRASVVALTSACYWGGNATFGAHAAMLLHAWFVDETTRMNPNLNFGQGWPGKLNGSGSGLVEVDENLVDLLDAVAMLQRVQPAKEPWWTPLMDAALGAWVEEWGKWLRRSPYSTWACNFRNNHNAACRAMWVAVAAWSGGGNATLSKTLVKGARERQWTNLSSGPKYLPYQALGLTPDNCEGCTGACSGSCGKAPIAQQIWRNGALPEEAGRVNSAGYTGAEIHNLMRLARFAASPVFGTPQAAELELFDYVSPANSSSIRDALDATLPFALGQKPWPYPSESERFNLFAVVREAAHVWGNNASYSRWSAQLKDACPGALCADDATVLWWPEVRESSGPGL